ncbi:hypothetical protein AR687_05655 [Flavobacteriaceae bacterium CRH]|nr:hypothetical protein AR687_05655 [Flavobacteriaceae bacterium CRH]
MKKDFIKIINGIYFFALLIWILYLLLLVNTNSRGYILLTIFILVSQGLVFFYSFIFFYLTKNIFTIKEQIIYGLLIFIILIDLFYIKTGSIDDTFIILISIINLSCVLYFLKNIFYKLMYTRHKKVL